MKIGLLYKVIGIEIYEGSIVRLMDYEGSDMFPCKIQYVKAYYRSERRKSLDGDSNGFHEKNLTVIMEMNRNGANS